MVAELVARNVVDRTFAAIHSRAVPWTVHAEWWVDGPVRGDCLEAAAEVTVRRHPLLRARQGDADEWIVLDPDEVPPVAVRFWDAPDERSVAALRGRLVSRRFDLRRDLPVRFDVVRAPDCHRVVVVADHALVDGVGIGRTAVSLMTAYVVASDAGAEVEPEAWSLGRRDPEAQHVRPFPFQLEAASEVDATWRDAHALGAALPPVERVQGVLDRLRERAVPASVRLAPERSGEDGVGSGEPRSGYGVAYHDLSAVASQVLASLPPRASTANDVLVTAFCLAGMRWNRRRGRPELPFSVGVPVNLRPARSWFEGVCNATMPWPVRVDDDAPGAALRQVTDQMRRVRAGICSTEVRAVLAHLSGRTGLSIRERQALATTTVVSIVPGAELARAHLPARVATSRLYGGAPAPPAMGMTFAVVPNGAVHRLSARYLRSRHSSSGAARFLQSVDDAIVQLCGLLEEQPTTLMEAAR